LAISYVLEPYLDTLLEDKIGVYRLSSILDPDITCWGNIYQKGFGIYNIWNMFDFIHFFYLRMESFPFVIVMDIIEL
jgi:hypothetical protein